MLTIQEKLYVKENYLNGVSYVDIANNLGIKKNTIYMYLRRSCDFYVMEKTLSKRFLKEQELEMIKIYNEGKTIKEISEIYNVSFDRINGFLSKKIKLRGDYKTCHIKYSCDTSFFENIDTEEKAYILGILYADGYNQLDMGSWSITLQEGDLDILLKIKKAMKSNFDPWFRKEYDGHQNTYKFGHRNKKMCEDLNKLGCVQKKSFTLAFPEFINDDLLHHFIRGYFDGDGHISRSFKNNGPYEKLLFSIVSSDIFCIRMKEEIYKVLGVTGTLTYQKNIKTSTYRVYGDLQIIKILNWMYKDATIFMGRKYNKYLEILESRKNRGLPI